MFFFSSLITLLTEGFRLTTMPSPSVVISFVSPYLVGDNVSSWRRSVGIYATRSVKTQLNHKFYLRCPTGSAGLSRPTRFGTLDK